MKNVIQIVDTTPTPNGQWVSFWDCDGAKRYSAEVLSNEYMVTFDLADVYVLVDRRAGSMDIVGPVPVDILKASEYMSLPVFSDQSLGARHNHLRRFKIDLDDGVISEVRLAGLPPEVTDGTPIEKLQAIAKFESMN